MPAGSFSECCSCATYLCVENVLLLCFGFTNFTPCFPAQSPSRRALGWLAKNSAPVFHNALGEGLVPSSGYCSRKAPALCCALVKRTPRLVLRSEQRCGAGGVPQPLPPPAHAARQLQTRHSEASLRGVPTPCGAQLASSSMESPQHSHLSAPASLSSPLSQHQCRGQGGQRAPSQQPSGKPEPAANKPGGRAANWSAGGSGLG